MIISLIITIIVLLCVDWSKFDYGSQFLSKGRKVSSGNLETNQLFERRPKEEEESTELLLDDSEYRHKIQRPEGFETLCQSDPSCSEGCDACCQLPYHNKTGKLHVHHYDSENWEFWNPHLRFEELASLTDGNL